MLSGTSLRQRGLLLLMACALLLMLLASLWQRMSQPSMTVERGNEAGIATSAPAGSADAAAMAEVGRLMREVGQNPENREALLRLTELLIHLEHWENAKDFAERAVKLNAKDAKARYLKAVIEHNLGRHAEAAASLEEVIRAEDSAHARYSLGVLYLHYLKQQARGIEQLSAALHAPDADENLKAMIRRELEQAKLPKP